MQRHGASQLQTSRHNRYHSVHGVVLEALTNLRGRQKRKHFNAHRHRRIVAAPPITHTPKKRRFYAYNKPRNILNYVQQTKRANVCIEECRPSAE